MAHLTTGCADYLAELARNNNREWFQANHDRYQRDVRVPFTELVAELIYRLREIDRAIAMEPRDAIFRIARDVRFTRDKMPYKPWMAASIAPGGRQTDRSPGFYFAVRWDGVHVGGGIYQPGPEAIARIRRAIARDGDALVKALRGRAYRKLYGGELLGERNKRLPTELAAVADRYPWVANRQFYYYAEYADPADLTRLDLTDWLMEHFDAARSVHAFLKAAVIPRDDE